MNHVTRIDNIYEPDLNRAIDLPGSVVVIAQNSTVTGLRELSDILSLYECELDQMPATSIMAKADIVVAEVDPTHEASIRRLDQIAAAHPGMPIIAGVEALDVRTTRALLKRGVTDFLEIPFTIEALLDALADVDLSGLHEKNEETHLAPVVAVMGCAGGVGTTTIATHLAGALLGDGGSAAIIDLDIQKGDVCDYLGMTPRVSLQDIIEADQRIDAEMLNSVMTQRDGLPDVLAAPTEILPIEEVKFEQLSPALATLRTQTDLLVIDMPGQLTNWGLSTLFASDRIVLVGELTVHSLRKMRRLIDFLISMGIERTVIEVVLNRVQTGLFKTIKTAEAEEALRHSIIAAIPDEQATLRQAQDQGDLVWSINARGKFEKAIRQFADELVERMEPGE